VVVRDDVKHNWYTRYYAAKSKLCIWTGGGHYM
jgi:hypothetical protein